MAASTNDKFTRTANGGIPTATTVTAPRVAGATSLTVGTTSQWPTASKVHFATYQINTSGAKVAGTQIDWSGIVTSGTAIGSLTRTGGATDAGNSVGDVVVMMPTAGWGEDLAEGLEVEHNRNGTHSAITSTSVSTGSITNTGNISQTNGSSINDDSSNELVKFAKTTSAVNEVTVTNAATGNAPSISATGSDTNIDIKLTPKGTGAVDLFGGVLKGMLYRRQGGSSTVYGTAGTTTYDSSTDKTITQAGVIQTSAAGDVTVTFPVAFTQVPLIVATANSATNASTFAVVVSPTASNFAIRAYTSSARVQENVAWIAIGPTA